MNIPKYIIVHHSGGSDSNPLMDSSNQTFEDVNEYHKQRFGGTTLSSLGFYLGYHYFIEKNGKLTKARMEAEEGAHTFGKNDCSIGVCLAGNFDLTSPTEEQKKTLSKLLQERAAYWSIPFSRIVPHRQFAHKTCYGNKLDDLWAATLTQSYIIRLLITLLSSLDKILNKKVGLSVSKNCLYE